MKPMPEAKWPPRVWVEPATITCSEHEKMAFSHARVFNQPGSPDDPEYLSLEEHTHLLSEAVAKAVADAVREAKAQAFEEAIDLADSVDTRDELRTKLTMKAAELRENGGKNG